jgi:Flp pilus assembly pilin Flp
MLCQLSYVRARIILSRDVESDRSPDDERRKRTACGPPKEVVRMTRFENLRSESGQTMSEYGVILAVITPAIVAVLALLSTTIGNRFLAVLDFLS